MMLNDTKIVYYALGISVFIHVLLLCVSFGKSSNHIQKHDIRVTVATATLLPHVETVSDATRLKNNRTEQLDKQVGMTSQYMVSKEDSAEVTMRYTDMIRQRIQEVLMYPPAARKDGIEGKAFVTFTINAHGNVIVVAIARSSGSALLDEAAILAIKKASPFPPIPVSLQKERMTFVQGLAFTLK